MLQWHGIARYADGSQAEITEPYTEEGNPYLERETQSRIECRLAELKEGCTYLSVDVENK